MINCRNCGHEISDEAVTKSFSQVVEFYECAGCGMYAEKLLDKIPVTYRFYKHVPQSQTLNDVVGMYIRLATGGEAPSPSGYTSVLEDVAKLAMGMSVRYLVSFAEEINFDEKRMEHYTVATGLMAGRPYLEFSGEKADMPVVDPKLN